MKSQRVAIAVLAIPLVLGLAACGSSSQTTTASTGTTNATPSTAQAHDPAPNRSKEGKNEQAKPPKSQAKPKQPVKFNPPVHHDSGGGSKQFEAKGGDNSIQQFGSEASGDEFSQAAIALHGYLDARAAGAWAAACSYMADGVTAQLSQMSGAGKQGGHLSCAKILAALSGGLPPAALHEVAEADVGSLRIEGERAFVLFHGAHGVDYFMPMVREGGEWKVAALAPSAVS